MDAHSGEAAWRYESLAKPYKGIVQQLQHADGSLVFGCYDGTVTRLNGENGEIQWRWRPDSHVHATPVIDLANRRLYINTEQENSGEPFGHLYSLDWKTGRVLWRHRHAYWPPATVAYSPTHRSVVATCNDKSIVCLDADTGELRWQARSKGLVRGRPALAGDRVLVATENGHLQSFDMHTGAEANARRHGAGLHQQFLHVQDGIAYVLDGKGHLTAFDVDGLGIRWLTRLRSSGVWMPVAFNGYLVVLSREGHLAVLDPQREVKLWEGSIGGVYRQPPALGYAGGIPMLVAASNHSGLKAFRIHDFYCNQEL
ncbi:hypothetical protein CS8_012900 [Cupriavidus sp. 8B]